MAMVPPVMSSRPATMRSVGRLAAARRPDQHDELVVGDVQVEILDGDDAAG